MVGNKIASSLCVLGIFLATMAEAQEAPVVQIQQPFSLIGYDGGELSETGMPYGDKEPFRIPDSIKHKFPAPVVSGNPFAEEDIPGAVVLASCNCDAAAECSCGVAQVGTAACCDSPAAGACNNCREPACADSNCAEPACGAAGHVAPVCNARCSGGWGGNGSVGWLGDGDACGVDCGGCSALGCLGEVNRCASQCIDWSCMDLCTRSGFWLRADYLMWWTPEENVPTLVTSSPLGTPIDNAGVDGLPTTTDRFSGPLFGDFRSGGQLSFGWAVDGCNCGLSGSIWGIQNDTNEDTFSSTGDPAFARPFFNTDPLVDAPDSQLVSYDGVLNGLVRVNTSSEVLGGDIGLRCNAFCCSDFCNSNSTRVDLYAGYRYFKVREGLRISEQLESTALTGPVAFGTQVDLFDNFRTENEFHGANFGIVATSQWGRWTGEMTTRLAVGSISRQARIDGQTTVTVPTIDPVTNSGGLLAQQTNIGSYEDSEFAVLPEFQLNGGYAVNCQLKLLFGYTFMYLGDVWRPGDIVDPVLNGQLLDSTIPNTGPERPRFTGRDSKMWAMGMNLGVEYVF